jgi:2'-5' RNA ligase
MAMRLFVAVTLDDEVVAEAGRVADEVRRRLPAQVRARWVDAANMHLTVRFIGQVDDDRVAAVIDAVRAPLPIAPFEIELGDCGAFPPSGPPRVIWIGLAAGLPSLSAMHDELNRRLAPLGLEAEDRAFSAHLTLARIRECPRGAARPARDAIAAVQPRPTRCVVDAATLFQSRLSPKGATYQPLANIPCLS